MNQTLFNGVRIRHLRFLPALFLLLTGILSGSTFTAAEAPAAETVLKETVLADTVLADAGDVQESASTDIIVFLMKEISEEEQAELARLAGGKVKKTISGAINALRLSVDQNQETDLSDVLENLKMDSRVMSAMPDVNLHSKSNTVVHVHESDALGLGSEPEDQDHDESHPAGNDWWAEAIGAYTAWNDYAEYRKPITVAVVDDGFDLQQPGLEGKITMLNDNDLRIQKMWGNPFSHGTHVAGIFASADNGTGVRGVADHAQILAFDIARGEEFGSDNDLISAISQSVEQGARVINMSLGLDIKNDLWTALTFNTEEYMEYKKDEAFASAVITMSCLLNLYLNGYKDILIVQSAGNSGVSSKINGYISGTNATAYQAALQKMDETNPDKTKMFEGLPYSYFNDRTIVVGGVDQPDADGNYPMNPASDYGNGVDICAPYSNITSLGIHGSNASIIRASGTSMSAPMVAGAAAFIWSMDLTMTPAEVKSYLLNSNENVHAYSGNFGDTRDSYPMLNIGKAARKVYEERVEKKPVQLPLGSDRTAMNRYIKEVLIPEYGVIPTDLLQMSDDYGAAAGWSDRDLEGLLSVNIRDFDGDGADEMLAVIFRSIGTETDLQLEMYECDYASSTVYRTARSTYDTVGGFIPGSAIGFRQTGIFTYTFNGGTYIGVDSHLYANETEATIAVFQYGGNGIFQYPDGETVDLERTPAEGEFYHIGSVALNYHGSGSTELLRAYSYNTPWQPLFGLFRYDSSGETIEEDTAWIELKKFDPYSDDGSWVDPGEDENSAAFMNAYLSEMQQMGLTADDARLKAWEDPRYSEQHTMTPDIYSATNGEISFLSGIYTYRTAEGQRELVRADYEHTLNMYR
ncbi:MAG: S8/S53 family peptidase [Lachnospiraceae bacterium]|nr:S8/S53 family peptidase [Lachnospiraceae bacterium]